MIEVADDQSLVTQIDKEMEQRDRIAPAGNADKIALGWRKFGNKFGINVQRAVAPNKRSTAGPERKSNGLTEQAVPLAAVGKIRKVLRPGGIILLPMWQRFAEPRNIRRLDKSLALPAGLSRLRVQPIRSSTARLDHQSETRLIRRLRAGYARPVRS